MGWGNRELPHRNIMSHFVYVCITSTYLHKIEQTSDVARTLHNKATHDKHMAHTCAVPYVLSAKKHMT